MENYNKEYAKDIFRKMQDKGGYNIFFKDLITKGRSNLENNSGKQRIYLANHQSHADYLVAWYLFHKENQKMPMIAAGKNLDLKFLNKRGIDFGKLGAFWVDRSKTSTGEREEISTLCEKIKNIYESNEDLMIFPEGGRSYSGDLFEIYKTGILKKAIKLNPEAEIVPIAFNYSKRIEEGFFPLMKAIKEKGKIGHLGYLTLDGLSFLKAYFYKGERTAKMNIGKPEKLEDITKNSKNDHQRINLLRSHSIKRIKELYEEIK